MNTKNSIMAGIENSSTRLAVQFLVYSSSIQPGEITARLKLQPTATTEKGSKRGKNTGMEVSIPRNMWMISSEYNVIDQDLTRHLDWVLSKIHSIRDEIQDLRSRGDTSVELVVIVWTSGVGACVRLNTDFLKILADLQLEVRLEFSDYGEES